MVSANPGKREATLTTNTKSLALNLNNKQKNFAAKKKSVTWL